MSDKINDAALDVLFREARSQNKWQDIPVSDAQLREIYEIMKWGATSSNSCPARMVFCRSEDAKLRLAGTASDVNESKIRNAPVVAIVAYDSEFHEYMHTLMPVKPHFKDLYSENEQLREITAFRNGTLQGAYLLMAIRAIGLDAGPMSGFDNGACDQEFFPDGRFKSNFLCCIGYGDPEGVFPRQYRFPFDDVCRLI